MPALAEPPSAAPPGSAASPRLDLPGGRFVLADVDWDVYEKLADGAGNEHLRFTYDATTGELEVEMPQGYWHESVAERIGLLIAAFARERKLRTAACGSVTLRRRRRGGVDGDKSYYVSNFDRRPPPGAMLPNLAAGQEPPSLVVEVDVTNPGVEKLPIYARLGVPEVWVWEEGELTCRRLTDAGEYAVTADSGELPGFPLAFAAGLLRDRTDASDQDVEEAFVAHLRASSSPAG